MTDKTIGDAYVKRDNVVRISVNDFRDQVYVGIREWGMDGDTGYRFPTSKGYSILAE